MTLAVAYWVLMIVWLAFGWFNRPPNQPYWWGGAVLSFVLFAILGWAVFGAPIK